MKLSTWIEKIGGRVVAAELLQVTPEAIHYWVTGKSTPSWFTMFKIIEASDGRVTPSEVFEETKVRERFQAIATRRRK